MSTVMHVCNDSALGHDVEASQATMKRLHDAGYSVAPVPADDQVHTVNQRDVDILAAVPCASCSPPVTSAGPAVRWGREIPTVSCRRCQSEIHLVNPDNPDGAYQDWSCSTVCPGGTVGPVHEPQWSTAQLQRDFTVEGFAMCICVARRKSDGQLGSLDFDHAPRFYYGWLAHER